MILSKANLAVQAVASRDPFDRALCGVLVERGGGTCAGNGRVLLAVGPVRPEVERAYPDVGERVVLAGDVILKVDHVQEAQRALPKEGGRGARAVLQNAALTRGDRGGDVALACVTAGGRTRKIADAPQRERYPDWRSVVRKVRGDDPLRVCVNRRDLLELLKALEEACPDKGNDCPVYLEIGSGIVARSVNRDTRQHAVGAVNAYRLEGGAWLERDAWEECVNPVLASKALVRK